MADQDQRRAQARQFAFQPFDRRQVEMIGRLVEQQNVGLGRERAGERGAAGLAAGEVFRLFVAGQAQRVEQVMRAIFGVARAEARDRHRKRHPHSRKGRAPAAGSARSRRAGRLAYVLGRVFEVSLIAGAWVAVSIAVGAPLAISVIGGAKFAPAVPVLAIQGIALGAMFVSLVWANAMLSLGEFRQILVISLSMLLLNALLVAALVPLDGARGAAVATAVAEIAAAVVQAAVVVRHRPQLRPSLRILPFVALAAAGGAPPPGHDRIAGGLAPGDLNDALRRRDASDAGTATRADGPSAVARQAHSRCSGRPLVIAVVHLVWGPLGPAPLRAFLASYRAHAAGGEHELVVLYNDVGRDRRPAFEAELEGVEHRALELEEPVQDLVAYARAASRLEHERVCFLNSHSVILAPGWLANLDGALSRPRAGIVGASGSWGSIHSYLRFSLGLGGFYSRVFHDRRATIATLEGIAERQERERPQALTHRKIPVLTYGAAVLDQAHGFPSFPARHIRTTGFMIRREVLERVRIPTLRRKNDAYRLESGKRSITAQVERLGLDALVVGRDGSAYGGGDWFASRTFWQGDQENLMIADKQTASYEDGGAAEREVLSRYAWGELADPRPPGPLPGAASGGPRQATAERSQPTVEYPQDRQ